MVANYPVASRLIFFFANFLQVVIAIIPGEPFELAAGYAFGALEGTIICMAAIYAASIFIFLLVKRFDVPFALYSRHPQRYPDLPCGADTDAALKLACHPLSAPHLSGDLDGQRGLIGNPKLCLWHSRIHGYGSGCGNRYYVLQTA